MQENLDLLARMKGGSTPRAKRCWAKIDMASPNMNMRDPLYRIRKVPHHQTGDS